MRNYLIKKAIEIAVDIYSYYHEGSDYLPNYFKRLYATIIVSTIGQEAYIKTFFK